MKVAFYKGTRPGFDGIYNRIVRWWEQGPYSHCELVFSDGMSASSAFLDGGVRFKKIDYDPDKWDLIDVSFADEAKACSWFIDHDGCKYDTLGIVRFGIGFLGNSKNRYFCSEAIAEALGILDPWRLCPNGLAAILPLLASK